MSLSVPEGPLPLPKVVAEDEPEELVRFREAWRAELKQRQTPTASSSSHPQPNPPGKPDAHPPSSSLSSQTSTVSRAVEVYRRAVDHEARSLLDDALVLYRQAFRLDPHVDRAYHLEEQRLNKLAAKSTSPERITANPLRTRVPAPDTLVQGLDALTLHHGKRDIATVTGSLATILAQFPVELAFEPEEGREREGTPISIIPDELLLHILRCLDTTTIERFARVNRKARVLTLDAAVWRDFVQLVYKPPQISDDPALSLIVDQYRADYRRVYIEHPRVRMDGIYIAVCHYVRSGLSENVWVKVSHLITYHRYLRFFPDGRVLSLLTNEEHQPQQVIPMLKPTLRMKGFYIGEWYLSGTTVVISNLVEMNDKSPGSSSTSMPPTAATTAHPQNHSHILSQSHAQNHTQSQPPTQPRYVFQMALALRSRPLGRWNKLELEAYDSVEVATGEAVPLPLRHERAFWFSRVRSYA